MKQDPTSPSIAHSRPWLTSADFRALDRVAREGMVARGKRTREFEERLEAYLGAAGVACVASGTSALVVVLSAIGLAPGDEVILPTYTCHAVYDAVLAAGGTPVLCDIGDGWTVTESSVRPHLSRRTKAIVAVHALGISSDVPALSTLGVPIIEDCCQALGAVRAHRQLPIGGAAAIYSFHATKCIATGEGGAVATPDADLAARVRAVLEHSRVPSAFTDLQAALGISQLARYEENLERRRRIADHYFGALPPLLTAPLRAVREHTMFYRFPLRLQGLDFTTLQARCARRGVAIRRGVDALLHRAEGVPDTRFPNASQRFEETFSIPIYPSLTRAEQTRVSRAVSEESDDPAR